MDCFVIRCTSEERARLIFKANRLIERLDDMRHDETPITAETVLSKCALEDLERNMEKYLRGVNMS